MLDNYVYFHRDPRNKEVFYVGKGTGARAWAMGTYRDTNPASLQYGRRDEGHAGFHNELLAAGYLPHEWVEIIARGLSSSEATSVEVSLIKELKPRFNKQHNPSYNPSKIPKEAIQWMKQLKEFGLSYMNVAHLTGVSTMTVRRQLKRLENV